MPNNLGFKDFKLKAPIHNDGHACRVLLHNQCIEYEILISEHPDPELSIKNIVMVQYVCAAGMYTTSFGVASNSFTQVVASLLSQMREQAIADVVLERRRLELEQAFYVN